MNLLPIRAMPAAALAADVPLICFSHLRWDFVLQRPQHLMSRFARERPVWFWEEMIPTDHHLAYLEFHAFEGTTVQAIRPRVPRDLTATETEEALTGLLNQFLQITGTHKPVLWFYTPQMWPFARNVAASAIVYDCMDELSGFRFAPPDLRRNEARLLAAADVVFTGGYSLYEAKRGQHGNIHPFPSSVDAAHFAGARREQRDPVDQRSIAHPRLGYYGVIDERLDLGLIRDMAAARPNWQIVMIGPLVKLNSTDLPRAANIHWLGQKAYADLPAYLSGWDVALMPFAINDATRFISPTKTLEYLAGGRRVVSTPVRDVVRHYGDIAAVRIANDAAGFIAACANSLDGLDRSQELDEVDQILSASSWDNSFAEISKLVTNAAAARTASDWSATPHLQLHGE